MSVFAAQHAPDRVLLFLPFRRSRRRPRGDQFRDHERPTTRRPASGLVLLMTYVGGVGYFAGPIVGAVIVTFLQITLSDLTSVWQLYFGLMFIGFVSSRPAGSPDGSCCIGKRPCAAESLAARSRLATVGAALAASGVGAILLIELADRQLALARSEGSVMRLFRLRSIAASVDAVDDSARPVLRRRSSCDSGPKSPTPGRWSTRIFACGARDDCGPIAD